MAVIPKSEELRHKYDTKSRQQFDKLQKDRKIYAAHGVGYCYSDDTALHEISRVRAAIMLHEDFNPSAIDVVTEDLIDGFARALFDQNRTELASLDVVRNVVKRTLEGSNEHFAQDVLQDIAKILGVSHEWLQTGQWSAEDKVEHWMANAFCAPGYHIDAHPCYYQRLEAASSRNSHAAK